MGHCSLKKKHKKKIPGFLIRCESAHQRVSIVALRYRRMSTYTTVVFPTVGAEKKGLQQKKHNAVSYLS